MSECTSPFHQQLSERIISKKRSSVTETPIAPELASPVIVTLLLADTKDSPDIRSLDPRSAEAGSRPPELVLLENRLVGDRNED